MTTALLLLGAGIFGALSMAFAASDDKRCAEWHLRASLALLIVSLAFAYVAGDQ